MKNEAEIRAASRDVDWATTERPITPNDGVEVRAFAAGVAAAFDWVLGGECAGHVVAFLDLVRRERVRAQQ